MVYPIYLSQNNAKIPKSFDYVILSLKTCHEMADFGGNLCQGIVALQSHGLVHAQNGQWFVNNSIISKHKAEWLRMVYLLSFFVCLHICQSLLDNLPIIVILESNGQTLRPIQTAFRWVGPVVKSSWQCVSARSEILKTNEYNGCSVMSAQYSM